jgi:hypothetical protein
MLPVLLVVLSAYSRNNHCSDPDLGILLDRIQAVAETGSDPDPDPDQYFVRLN